MGQTHDTLWRNGQPPCKTQSKKHRLSSGRQRKAGLDMWPAKVIAFGTPKKSGTPLMVKDPEFALQLPKRVLVTETDGRVKVVFNDTRALIAGSKINYSEVENILTNAEKPACKVVTE